MTIYRLILARPIDGCANDRSIDSAATDPSLVQCDRLMLARSIDGCANYGSMDSAARSIDHANRSIAHNSFIQHSKRVVDRIYSVGWLARNQ